MNRSRALMSFVVIVLSSSACSQAPQVRGRIAGLEKLTEQAERNGAVHCAPRELAEAQSHLKFARIELEQGFVSKAEHHLWVAEPNAHAANMLSPPQYCTQRGFVEVGPKRDADTDNDGVADLKDACLLDPEDKDAYLDDDGCPEPDNDLDTLLDASDKCPNEAEDPDGYQDEDGCPDLDNDNDTVADVKDQCPNELGSATEEPLGCPSSPALALVTDCEVKITQQIHFEFDKDKIRPESFPVLDAVASVLDKNPDIKLEVQGHTDNKGSARYNKNLSERRAASVMKYLASHGVTPARLTSHGYGFDRPLVPNTTADNRALNRRVQFIRTEGSKEGCPKTQSAP